VPQPHRRLVHDEWLMRCFVARRFEPNCWRK